MIKSTLGSLWLFGIPKDPFALVLIYPLTTVVVAANLWHPGSHFWATTALALLLDLTFGFWHFLTVVGKSRSNLLGTLGALKDCRYVEHELERLVPPEKVSRVTGPSLLSLFERYGLPYRPLRDVRVYQVKIGESGTIPSDLAAFNLPFLGATILMRDDPSDEEPRERFRFWHEIGHAMGSEFAHQAGGEKGIKHPIIALLLGALLSDHSASAFLLLGLAAIALILIGRLLRRRRLALKLASEMSADEYAVSLLEPSDRELLLAEVETLIAKDRELSELQHSLRLLNLTSLLRDGRAFGESLFQSEFHWWDSELLAVLFLGWWCAFALHFSPLEGHRLTQGWWLLGLLFCAALIRYGNFYFKGFLVDFILLGTIRWNGEKFTWRGRSSTPPQEA